VRGVLIRLRDLLKFSPRAPSGLWPSSRSYFQHACARKPALDEIRYEEWASGSENIRSPAKTVDRKHPLFDPVSPYLHGKYPDTFVVCVPRARVADGKGSVIADDGKMLFDVSIDWSTGRTTRRGIRFSSARGSRKLGDWQA
jgi:hypothetical protein